MTIRSNLRKLFKSPFDHGAAHKLYVAIVHQSRLPVFYDKFEVQDTPEGRFDLLTIHTYLVLRRLREEHEKTAELSQALFDLMFADLDQNLREMGYGDTGVAMRIRKMAEGFYGRIKAYDEGLAAPDRPETETPGALAGMLAGALDRNLYRNTRVSGDTVAAMVHYTRLQEAHMAGQGVDTLMEGHVTFCAPTASVTSGGE